MPLIIPAASELFLNGCNNSYADGVCRSMLDIDTLRHSVNLAAHGNVIHTHITN